MPYDSTYWKRYLAMDATDVAQKLTDARVSLVDKYWNGDVVDIGIGGGKFVCSRKNTYGYDVNPDAIDWLHGVGLYQNPYATEVEAATFWDSLEHIHNPLPLLRNVRKFAFVSMPIYKGPEHVLRSKHFRKDEHCWYFTVRGFQEFMYAQGFDLLERNEMEQDCGREDIGTFVFGRSM